LGEQSRELEVVGPVAELLSRRQVLSRASALGLGGLVLSALPVAERLFGATPVAAAAVLPSDATLQAFADTMVPGRKVLHTDLGHEVDPRAIAGVHSAPGGVESDALALYHHPNIGFDALEPSFLSDLEGRSLLRGGQFIDLPFAKRVEVCVEGLGASNPSVQVWEAAAAVPFTAFLTASLQKNATIDTASGYQVMGHPGTAPNGYADFAYKRKLARERTALGYLP
jgi:enediyne biosynthesis protein E8